MAAPRVLVVEDEAIPARAAAVMLGHIGCDVAAIVDSGEEAVEAACRERPDLVLMDIRLKGPMDGIEAAGLIRERLGIPIVFVSAYLTEELDERHDAIDESEFLSKPIDQQALAAGVRRVMRGLRRQ